jgi:hypothetical protein
MPGGVITTGNHPKLLWPGVHAIWGQMYDEHAKEYPQLYDIESSDQAYEEDVQITGFGLAAIKPEGANATYDSEIQGFISRYVHIAYSLGYIVTYEELRDNLYERVSNRRAKANAFSFNQTIENIAAFLYNNATSSTYYTTGDGVALASAAHTTAFGTTYSNVLTPGADLTEAAIEDLIVQIMGATSDRGLLINLMPEVLIVPRQEWFNANRIMKSVLQPGGSSNNINVLNSTNAFPKGIVMNHYLTNPSRWFIRTNVPEGMKLFWREKPNFAQDNDFDTKNAKSLGYMRLSVGATDPRGLYTSDGP